MELTLLVVGDFHDKTDHVRALVDHLTTPGGTHSIDAVLVNGDICDVRARARITA